MVDQISDTMKFFDNNNHELMQENDDLEEAILYMRRGLDESSAGFSFVSEPLFEPSSQLGYP